MFGFECNWVFVRIAHAGQSHLAPDIIGFFRCTRGDAVAKRSSQYLDICDSGFCLVRSVIVILSCCFLLSVKLFCYYARAIKLETCEIIIYSVVNR